MRVGGEGANGGRGTEDGIGDGYASHVHGNVETGVGETGHRGSAANAEMQPARLEADKNPEGRERGS